MEELVQRIHREGPLPFSQVVDLALYGPHGFYTNGGGAGRRRDFLTSPEVGSLFGAIIARALDAWWNELGCPDPFLVAECGAGPGTLAATVLAAQPACAPALRYLLVDSSEHMRALHRGRHLPLGEAAELFAVTVVDADSDDAVVKGQGPLCASMPALPSVPLHVVLANELLDNLPFDIIRRTDGSWNEVRVGVDANDALIAIEVQADGPLVHWGERYAASAAVGAYVPIAQRAGAWVAEAYESLVVDGHLLCIDYGKRTSELADGGVDWLRTYRSHSREFGIDAALRACGETDITIDVPLDQLPMPMRVSTQAGFLESHGLRELLADARVYWDAHAAEGDLAALKARSWLGEGEALCDPAGLGAFAVLEWKR